MTDNGNEVRRIVWREAFPWVRLFQTFGRAIHVNRLALALAAIVVVYIAGRVLDAIWKAGGGGVAAMSGAGRVETEIQAYATGAHPDFAAWLRETRAARDQMTVTALLQARKAANPDEARQMIAQGRVPVLYDKEFQSELRRLSALVQERHRNGIRAIEADAQLDAAARKQRRAVLDDAAREVMRMLHGDGSFAGSAPRPMPQAVETLVHADATVDRAVVADDLADISSAAARLTQLQNLDRAAPAGPFIRLLAFESHCFAAAIDAAWRGRWGFTGHAFSATPGMLGSIETALRGKVWLLTQRPGYAILFCPITLVVFAFFGGGICRSVAVNIARDDNVSSLAALKFVRERFGGLLAAPLMPVGILAGIAFCLWIGGLIGAIPFLGELLASLFFPLALLAGFAGAMVLVALVLGFHLMWPTIAVEGSDGFDALSRSCSYVGSRIWHVLFYAFSLLLYGAAAYLMVRLIAVLTLKLSHFFVGLGMNLVDRGGIGKLDAMWRMPGWADLSLLPRPDGPPIWGYFEGGPVGGAGPVAVFLLQLWVFLVVSLVGAFVVSFFFCGSTQSYFLLRRDVDATDFDELYYEELENEAATPGATAPVGTDAGVAASVAGETSGPVAEGEAAGGGIDQPAT